MLSEPLFASRRPMAILDNRLTYLGKLDFLVFIISSHYLPKKLLPSTESGQVEPFWSPLLKKLFWIFSAEEDLPLNIPLDTFSRGGRTF